MVRCYPSRSPVVYRVTARDWHWDRIVLRKFANRYSKFSDVSDSVRSFNSIMSYCQWLV